MMPGPEFFLFCSGSEMSQALVYNELGTKKSTALCKDLNEVLK